MGAIAEAEANIQSALNLQRTEFLESEHTAEFLEVLAAIRVKQGRQEDAYLFFSAADRIRSSLHSRAYPATYKVVESSKEALEHELGEAAVEVWEKGQSLTVADAVKYALA